MSWLINFFTSSIGRKIIMSLTGIFLILFLTIHLIGNLQLLYDDGGKTFNLYAKMMGENPLIQIISKGNFFFILLHAVMGIVLWFQNKSAKGSRYAVKANNTTFSSQYMASFGMIILAFILLHLYQFFLQMKAPELFNSTEMATYDGVEVRNLYKLVAATFSNIGYVIFYVISMIVIGLHLSHGFQSAFQTLGLNHKKYTPAIEALGKLFSIVVPAGFALIPLYHFFIN